MRAPFPSHHARSDASLTFISARHDVRGTREARSVVALRWRCGQKATDRQKKSQQNGHKPKNTEAFPHRHIRTRTPHDPRPHRIDFPTARTSRHL